MEKSTAQQFLGHRIRNLRKSKNMTQEELAAKSELRLEFILGVEKGQMDPSLEDLAKIAEALGVEMFDLVKGEQEEKTLPEIRKEIIEIIDEMEKKDRKNLKLILEILRALR